MTEIKTALLSICMISIVTGILKMLLPDGKFKSQISFLISCVFAIIVFSIADKGIDISGFDLSDIEAMEIVDYSESYIDATYAEVAKSVREKLENHLDENGIAYRKINVNVHIDNDFCISINELELVFDDGTIHTVINEAIALVQQEVGNNTVVRYSLE